MLEPAKGFGVQESDASVSINGYDEARTPAGAGVPANDRRAWERRAWWSPLTSSGASSVEARHVRSPALDRRRNVRAYSGRPDIIAHRASWWSMAIGGPDALGSCATIRADRARAQAPKPKHGRYGPSPL